MVRSEPSSGARGRLRDVGFAERLRRGDTYGLLLGLIVLDYVGLAVFEDRRWSRAMFAVATGATLILSLHTSHVRGRATRVALVATSIVAGAALVHGAGGGGKFMQAASYLMFLLLAGAPVAIVVRIARHPVVNLETILGAICAYMLLGMIFAGAYRGCDALDSQGFFRQTSDPTPVQFVYFSFTTLTTLGYGDLTPADDYGRVLVSFEALMGQVFLVTIVAGLVGSFGQERQRLRPSQEPGPQAD